jgi:hypothetical protein
MDMRGLVWDRHREQRRQRIRRWHGADQNIAGDNWYGGHDRDSDGDGHRDRGEDLPVSLLLQ